MTFRITDFGTQIWYNDDNKYHCIDGPAMINVDGTKHWYFQGRRHRVDGPAIEWWDGDSCFYLVDFRFNSKEEWFAALTSEQKENYIWNKF